MKNECVKLVLREFGEPTKVVSLEEEEVANPEKDEVLVKMLMAAVNPSDINMIEGKYPVKPKLPSSPGFEGVGEVMAIGPEVTQFAVGDRVVLDGEVVGSWRSLALFKQDELMKIPKDVPIVEAAGLICNACTAYRLLKDFGNLSAGDVVIQNGANSACGQNIIQLCKQWGLKSVNIIRDRPNIEALRNRLISLGADYVFTEEQLRLTTIFSKEEIPYPKLALNCVGGMGATRLIRYIAPKGVMVTYGGMSLSPVTISTSAFIFQHLRFEGFYLTSWYKENGRNAERIKMMDELTHLMSAGKLVAPTSKCIPLKRYEEALEKTIPVKGFSSNKYYIDFRKN